MTDDQWRQALTILEQALDLDPTLRERFLIRSCDGDTEVLAEVRNLLAGDEQLGDSIVNAALDRFSPRGKSDSSRDSLHGVSLGSHVGLRIADGRYLLQHQVDDGGMGVVYRAVGPDGSSPYAVKVLKELPIDQTWLREQFNNEIDLLRRLDHPGIVTVIEAGSMPDGQPYFVMPFIDGVTLRSEIRGRMDAGIVARIVRQLGNALGAAHDAHVYHLDLKPSNVLIQCATSGKTTALLIDFGIAKLRTAPGQLLELTTIVGTVDYMAPEQRCGAASSASDVYALALIAFEMLTGTRLSQRDRVDIGTPATRRALTETYSWLSDAVLSVLIEALALDPRMRPTASEFGNNLASSLIAETENIVPRRRFVLTAVAVFVVLVAGGGVFFARLLATGGEGHLSTAAGATLDGASSLTQSPQSGDAFVAERWGAYNSAQRALARNFVLQVVFGVCAIVIILLVPERIRIASVRVSTTWTFFLVAVVLIYLWLEFGFVVDNLIQWRSDAWQDLLASGNTGRASLFNDGGYVDGWFLAFRPAEHAINARFRVGSVFFFCLVYGSLFAVSHAGAITLLYLGQRRTLLQARRRLSRPQTLFLRSLPWVGALVLVMAHLQFLLGGDNPNWFQPLVAVVSVALGVVLFQSSRDKRLEDAF